MKRRNFLKKALSVGALAATAPVVSFAKEEEDYSNGVVIGHSPKKEILYKKTENWEIYYKNAR